MSNDEEKLRVVAFGEILSKLQWLYLFIDQLNLLLIALLAEIIHYRINEFLGLLVSET